MRCLRLVSRYLIATCQRQNLGIVEDRFGNDDGFDSGDSLPGAEDSGKGELTP